MKTHAVLQNQTSRLILNAVGSYRNEHEHKLSLRILRKVTQMITVTCTKWIKFKTGRACFGIHLNKSSWR